VAGSANEAFVRRYKARFGSDEPTNMCVEAAYFQVHIFARALAEVNSLDTDLLRPMVLGSKFDAPQGEVCIDNTSNHTDLWVRIGKVDARGAFAILRESTMPMHPDPYLVACRVH